jgi:hypothetical protein
MDASNATIGFCLQQIDALDAAIAEIDREADAGLACFRAAVQQLSTIPGVSELDICAPGPACARATTKAPASAARPACAQEPRG